MGSGSDENEGGGAGSDAAANLAGQQGREDGDDGDCFGGVVDGGPQG